MGEGESAGDLARCGVQMTDDYDPFFQRAKCPHKRIEHCPLYAASHDAKLAHMGCLTDLAAPCLVEVEASYNVMVEVLRASDPRMVAIMEWRAELEVSREQRARNMRAAGIQ